MSSYPEEVKLQHQKLLVKISDNIDPKSDEFQNLVQTLKACVPKGRVARTEGNISKLLDLLVSQGVISIGNYQKLSRYCKDSGNLDLVDIIDNGQNEVRKLMTEQGISLPAPAEQGAMSSTTAADAVPYAPHSPAKKQKRTEQADVSDQHPINQDYSCYNKGGERGYLLILNSYENRAGTEHDVDNLKQFFGDTLKFVVDDPRSNMTKDMTRHELQQCLSDAADKLKNLTLNNFYCFVCAILSHGNEKGLATSDGAFVSVDNIRKTFSSENIRNFAAEIDHMTCNVTSLGEVLESCRISVQGRPKLFLIQACRGYDTQKGHDAADDEPEVPIDLADILGTSVPTDADILIAYATTPGYQAFRRKTEQIGSWFIYETINAFKEDYKKRHVEEMLIKVRGKVALEWATKSAGRQMPCTWSTLTKCFYFK